MMGMGMSSWKCYSRSDHINSQAQQLFDQNIAYRLTIISSYSAVNDSKRQKTKTVKYCLERPSRDYRQSRETSYHWKMYDWATVRLRITLQKRRRQLLCIIARHSVNPLLHVANKKTAVSVQTKIKLECGPMSNVMAALPNIGGTLCSTPQFG